MLQMISGIIVPNYFIHSKNILNIEILYLLSDRLTFVYDSATLDVILVCMGMNEEETLCDDYYVLFS